MLLRKRKGLQQPIQDVVQGQAPYKAVLVYDVIGYTEDWVGGWLETRRRIRALRVELMNKIADLSRRELSINKIGGRSRTCLRTNHGQVISVIACRPIQGYKARCDGSRNRSPANLICPFWLLVRLECRAFKDLFLIILRSMTQNKSTS